jgi:hypothetical protein
MQTAGRITRKIKDEGIEYFNVDDIGVGGGVVDRCTEQDLPVHGINVGEAADDKEKFANRRAEIWWGLRERFRNQEISIPDDEVLIAQLSTIKYKYSSSGKIVVESKDDIKKRGLKSPDRADALGLAFYPKELTDASANWYIG